MNSAPIRRSAVIRTPCLSIRQASERARFTISGFVSIVGRVQVAGTCATSPDWRENARSLVDILIAGARPII